MIYHQFADFVASLEAYDERIAIMMRPYLKIERLTYRDLRKRAYQTAHYLLSKNVQSGDRVMVIAGNSPEWVELLLGVQLIGAILVPVDVGNTLDTAKRFIKQTKPKLIFKNKYLVSELGTSDKICLLDGLHDYIAEFPTEPPKHIPKGSDTAVIVFTSGTTADPKGVVLTQRNVLANIEGIQQALTIDPNWRLLSVLPLSHMYELTGGCLAPLSRGAGLYYMPRVTPMAIARALEDYHITTILAIPQLLSLLLERIKQTAAAQGKTTTLQVAFTIAAGLPMSLRRLLFRNVHARLGGHLALFVTGGAPIPLETATMWERMGVKLVQGYGLTETSPILAVNRLTNRRLDSPGLPLDNVLLQIAEDGEIQAKGPNVFAEYWQNTPATRAAFTSDGWFKTGDTGKLQDGWLFIQGRLKFAVVLSSGLKVFPEDVELVAAKYPALKSVCVVGVATTDGEQVEAVVISDKSDHIVEGAITEINNQLASFQHIARWRRWPDDDFPRTRLLKIDRKEVQKWANATTPEERAQVEKPKQQADPLLGIIRLSLHSPVKSIKETDQLADLGLDSLRRLNVVALIGEQLGVTVEEEYVTQTTTVAKLRQLVADSPHAEPPPRRPAWTYWWWVRRIGNITREIVIRGIVRIWVTTTVEGTEKLQNLQTPALFIFNHVDDFDVPVVYQALPHYIRKRLAVAQADDVMRKHTLLAFISRLCFASFNMNRSEPFMPSLEYVCYMVDKGWNVSLAPEGRLSTDGKLQPFKSGIGLLAVELGIPVVPIKTIGLTGTVPLHAKWPKKHSRVTVRIGKPIVYGRHMNYDEVTKELQRSMETL